MTPVIRSEQPHGLKSGQVVRIGREWWVVTVIDPYTFTRHKRLSVPRVLGRTVLRGTFKALRWTFQKCANAYETKKTPTAWTASSSGQIEIQCPGCSRRLRVPSGKRGRIRCPGCSMKFEAKT